jgi:uncharacterized RDD family membrane protein YckC
MPATASEPKSSAVRVYAPHATRRMESLAGLPLASFRARAGGFVIDMILVLLAYIPVMWLIKWLIAGRKAGAHIDISWDFHELSNVIFTVLYFGLTLFWGNGRTLGKRVVGIRVISLVHERITFWQSMERALGYGASFLEGGFGFVQYFTNPNRCCVHDRIAETIVVRNKHVSDQEIRRETSQI